MLAPGGVLRVVVPDLDRAVADYDPRDPDRFLWAVYQGRSSREMGSARHWWAYNAHSMEALLRRVGFREVHQRGYREGELPDLERVDNRPGSLFMEAVK